MWQTRASLGIVRRTPDTHLSSAKESIMNRSGKILYALAIAIAALAFGYAEVRTDALFNGALAEPEMNVAGVSY